MFLFWPQISKKLLNTPKIPAKEIIQHFALKFIFIKSRKIKILSEIRTDFSISQSAAVKAKTHLADFKDSVKQNPSQTWQP